jgi:hypothetical protein
LDDAIDDLVEGVVVKRSDLDSINPARSSVRCSGLSFELAEQHCPTVWTYDR